MHKACWICKDSRIGRPLLCMADARTVDSGDGEAGRWGATLIYRYMSWGVAWNQGIRGVRPGCPTCGMDRPYRLSLDEIRGRLALGQTFYMHILSETCISQRKADDLIAWLGNELVTVAKAHPAIAELTVA